MDKRQEILALMGRANEVAGLIYGGQSEQEDANCRTEFIDRLNRMLSVAMPGYKVSYKPTPNHVVSDLLEALQGLMWRFTDDDADPNEPDLACPDIIAARAAITKATT